MRQKADRVAAEKESVVLVPSPTLVIYNGLTPNTTGALRDGCGTSLEWRRAARKYVDSHSWGQEGLRGRTRKDEETRRGIQTTLRNR